MELGERIPALSDKELENLHNNAVRLAQAGTPKQRQQAEELLPLLGAELEERRRARTVLQVDKRRANARRAAPVRRPVKDESNE